MAQVGMLAWLDEFVGRQVFSFAWNEDFWLPMFQFKTLDYSLHPGMRPLMGELADVMDGWAIAACFVLPNDLLGGKAQCRSGAIAGLMSTRPRASSVSS